MNTERESYADRVADRVAWEADDGFGGWVPKGYLLISTPPAEVEVEEAHQCALDEWEFR